MFAGVSTYQLIHLSIDVFLYELNHLFISAFTYQLSHLTGTVLIYQLFTSVAYLSWCTDSLTCPSATAYDTGDQPIE